MSTRTFEPSAASTRPPRALAVLAVLAALAPAPPAAAQMLPVANAGPDQEIPCAPPAGVDVTLDGSASFDPDDPAAVLTYTWSNDALLGAGVTLDGAMPVVLVAPGTWTFTLTVDDGVDGSAMDDVVVTVVADTEPPTLVLETEALEFWPPNHKYREIAAADVVEEVGDACDTELSVDDVTFTAATSDEADDGAGDGSTTDDVLYGEGCSGAFVRSERAGPGDGRVYMLTLGVADAAGNAAEAMLAVSVPHDRAHDAVDSGVVESYAPTCAAVALCPAEPDPDCTDAGDADVSVEDGRLRWRATGFAASEDDLGGEDADFQLCVFTDDGTGATLVDDPAAPAGSGWKHGKGGKRFHARRAGPAAGLSSLKLSAKKGTGKLRVDAPSDALDLPLADGTTITLQLLDSEGGCLGSEVEASALSE